MSEKAYPPCKAWSQLKKTLNSKESRDFWSVILVLMNNAIVNKTKVTEDYYDSILKYYCAGRKEKNETFKLMEQTARHYDVYDLFLQSFKSAYDKDTRKLSPGVIDLVLKVTKDDVLRDDYMRHLSTIRESLDAIEPEFFCQLNSPISSGEKVYSEHFEHELYHQFRQHDISLSKDNLLVKTHGENLLSSLCKLSEYYKTTHVDSNYEVSLPRFIYSHDLVASIKHIPNKYRSKFNDIIKRADIVCYYIPSETSNNSKSKFACMTLGEVLNIVENKKQLTYN